MASTNSFLHKCRKSSPFLFKHGFTVLQIYLVIHLFQSSQQIYSVNAWGSSDDDSTESTAIYGDALSRDWLYSSTGISLRLEGCVWGYVYSNDNADCMENNSQDGTTYWYQMANCRRAQAVYRMYGTSNGYTASCSNSNFEESVRSFRGSYVHHQCFIVRFTYAAQFSTYTSLFALY